MATITDFEIPDDQVPHGNCADRLTMVQWSYAAPASDGPASGDRVNVCKVGAKQKVVAATISVDGTLGTGCTILLAVGTTAITAATTAAAAGNKVMSIVAEAAGSDGYLNVLVGGADVGAAANIKVFALLADVD